MERFCFEVPGIARKDDAIAYIQEFYEYGSDINVRKALAEHPEYMDMTF